MYRLTKNSMCLIALRLALRMASTSEDLDSLRYCQVLKWVHSGLPISMSGRCSLMTVRALSCLAGLLKSQGCPSAGSLTVKSNANPGKTCLDRFLLLLSSAVTRGGEYISDTMRVQDARVYLLRLRP